MRCRRCSMKTTTPSIVNPTRASRYHVFMARMGSASTMKTSATSARMLPKKAYLQQRHAQVAQQTLTPVEAVPDQGEAGHGRGDGQGTQGRVAHEPSRQPHSHRQGYNARANGPQVERPAPQPERITSPRRDDEG